MNTRKGIIYFFVIHLIVNIIVIFFIGFMTPRLFTDIYVSGNASAFIFFNSLVFLPIYFIFGFIGGRIVKLTSSIQLYTSITIILTGLFIIAFFIDDHSFWWIYSVINAPQGWTMMEFSISEDYKNILGLLFTLIPALAFTSSVYLQSKIKIRKNVISKI